MLFLILFVILLAGLTWFIRTKLRASLPRYDGTQHVTGLEAPVTITSDHYGIPTITAQSRLDALRALGYVSARDRMFQMDLLRRLAGGRLSELMGKATLNMDTNQRAFGLIRVAREVVATLPGDQKAAAQAYADGVNAFLRQMRTPPPEYLGLRSRPEPWTLEDTVLVGLYLFKDLTETADAHERTISVMEDRLPPEVFDFLTAEEDLYTTLLGGGTGARRPMRPIPVEALAALRAQPTDGQEQPARDPAEEFVKGSNGWVVSPAKTSDGRAILASDMHLSLTVPNIWYQVVLRYDNVELAGVVAPGLPTIIIGANKHVAWGFTNLRGDFIDLVKLELHPEDAEQYKTPEGWARFETVEEVIRVRGKPDVVHPVKLTRWGPVSRRPLLGQPVAIRWTLLDPQATDLALLDIDRTKSVSEAIEVLQRAGLPPMNAMIADAAGHIGWTLCGKIPLREGFDGNASRSWGDGAVGWRGYIPAHELPVVIDPPTGFLVTANNRTLGKDYPYPIGHNFSSGYRAARITQELSATTRTTEQAMFDLQLDTLADFYEVYRTVALEALTPQVVADNPRLNQARQALIAWNGRADVDSKGLPILVRFREELAETVFSPFLARCTVVDDQISYAWNSFEQPLRVMITEKHPVLLPDPEHYADWDAFIVGNLDACCGKLAKQYPKIPLSELTWGRVNRVVIRHPLATVIPPLGRFLNMPRDPLPGCIFSIRAAASWLGSSVRLSVAPGHTDAGLVHLPCGQSGHPLSKHYKSQQNDWLTGRALPFLSGKAVHTLVLQPR